MTGMLYTTINIFLYWKRLVRYSWHSINYISHVHNLLSTAMFSIPMKHHQSNLNNNSKSILMQVAHLPLKFLSPLLPTLGFLKTIHRFIYSRIGLFVWDRVSLCFLHWPQTCGFKQKSCHGFLHGYNHWTQNATVFWLFFLKVFIKLSPSVCTLSFICLLSQHNSEIWDSFVCSSTSGPFFSIAWYYLC